MTSSIKKVPAALVSGDRIIFATIMGGTNEVVTVESVKFADGGIAYIRTLEKPFPILSLMMNEIEVVT